MKVMIVALALVAVAAAVSPPYVPEVEPVKILRAEFESQPDGAFVSSFETENGISQAVVGEIKEVLNEKNEKQNILVVRGSYSYPRADGSIEKIEYYGDENGFHAEGDSIPKVPVVARR